MVGYMVGDMGQAETVDDTNDIFIQLCKHEKNTSSSPFFNIMNHDHNPSISIINLPSYPDKTKMASVSTKHDINNITFLASQQ